MGRNWEKALIEKAYELGVKEGFRQAKLEADDPEPHFVTFDEVVDEIAQHFGVGRRL